VYARQRRQFIPQGAMSFVEIAGFFVDLLDVMPGSGRRHMGIIITDMFKCKTCPANLRNLLSTPLCFKAAPVALRSCESGSVD
jgi:hypothetical protein